MNPLVLAARESHAPLVLAQPLGRLLHDPAAGGVLVFFAAINRDATVQRPASSRGLRTHHNEVHGK